MPSFLRDCLRRLVFQPVSALDMDQPIFSQKKKVFFYKRTQVSLIKGAANDFQSFPEGAAILLLQ